MLMDSKTRSAAESVKDFPSLNAKLYALVTLTIDEVLIAAYGTNVLDGFTLWDNLRSVFKPSGSEVTAAERQLASLRLSAGGRVEPHIALFKLFLAKIDPHGTRFPLTEQVRKLFDSLPAPFQSLRHTIHHSGALSFDEVCNRITHLSSVLRAAPGHSAAFASDNLSSEPSGAVPDSNYRDRSHITCQFCGAKRHTARDCFTLLGLLKSSPRDQLQAALTENVYNTSLRQDIANRVDRFQPRKRASFASHCPTPLVSRLAVSAQATAMLATSSQGGALIDSGCTMHMTSDASLVSSLVPKIHEISTAKEGSFLYSTHEGDLTCGLGRCLVVPGLGGTLLSSGRLRRDGFVYSFSFESPHGGCDTWSMTKGNLTFTASTSHDGTLYFVPCQQLRTVVSASVDSHTEVTMPSLSALAASFNAASAPPSLDSSGTATSSGVATSPQSPTLPRAPLSTALPTAAPFSPSSSSGASPSLPVSSDIVLWHHRLGHLNMRSVGSLRDFISVSPSSSLATLLSSPCHGCALGKIRRLPFDSESHVRADKPLERLYMDLKGPVNTVSLQGNRYALLVVDDNTRYQWSIYLPNKTADTVRTAIDNLFQKLEIQHNQTIRSIRTDRGSEFVNQDLSGLLALLQVDHTTAVPYSSASMGTVERRHQTLTNDATAMMVAAGLDKTYWQYADACATYIRNRVPTASNRDKASPHELLFNERPTLTHLKVFGCPAFARIPDQFRSKFDARAIPTLFVGYPSDSVGYLCFDPIRRREVRSRDVVFDEAVVVQRSLAAMDRPPLSDAPVHSLSPPSSFQESDVDLTLQGSDVDFTLDSAVDQITSVSQLSPVEEIEVVHDLAALHDAVPNSSPLVPPSADVQSQNVYEDVHPPISRRSTRMRSPPKRLLDYDMSARAAPLTRPVPDSTNIVLPPYNPTTTIPDAHVCPADSSASFSELEVSDLVPSVPTTISEAISGPDRSKWTDAIDSELSSLIENKVYDVVPGRGHHLIPSKFVFRVKEDAAGLPTVFKARLVAKGFAQRPGFDYGDTFAPVAHSSSLLLLIATAAHYNFYLGQADIRTAFLYGDLNEEVYLQPPAGVAIPRGSVWRLRKSLYGLKQAPACWNTKLDGTLVKLGLHPTTSDPCVYQGEVDGKRILLAVYVDDLIIAACNRACVESILRKLGEYFSLKDLGRLEWCLGIRVTYGEGFIKVSQSAYSRSIVDALGLSDAKPITSPSDPATKLGQPNDCTDPDPPGMDYGCIVGKLLHLARWTRPDICFAVAQVGRFCSPGRHGPQHWEALRRIGRYLVGTIDLGICYSAGSSTKLILTGYSDADWAGEPVYRRSTSGTVILVNGSPISWVTKLQDGVALSSCESEYIALQQTIKELSPIRELLVELELLEDVPVVLVDNQAAIQLAKNPTANRKRSKHIEVKYSYTRSVLQTGKVRLTHCGTEYMLADAFTKSLHGTKLRSMFPYMS